MLKKDIFEVLREKVQCEYISDLKYVEFERIRVHLKCLDKDDFSLNDICDAVNYFGGAIPENVSKEKAWNSLLYM